MFFCCGAWVRFWHLADVEALPKNVRYWTNNGQRATLGLSVFLDSVNHAFRLSAEVSLIFVKAHFCSFSRFKKTKAEGSYGTTGYKMPR
jgi:hypothetical protein